MPSYRRRPEPVTAEQVKQGRIVDGMVMHRERASVKDLDTGAATPLYVWAVQTSDGWERVYLNDWVVRFENGTRKVYSDGAFNKFFESA